MRTSIAATFLAAILAMATAHAQPVGEAQARRIDDLLSSQFGRPGSPVVSGPIVVEGDYAIAGWYALAFLYLRFVATRL